ncbi:MAG TPA: spermidine/putrescine ABC transporter ATP-binding protein [Elusimicrobia bacterium]|nr:spermidine/putrescine ABC transporter ATP-binding protein [Elusimicrobiota bacterium]
MVSEGMDEQYSVEIKDISKDFHGNPVVRGVDFDIRKGEFFALLGPSGCGKTTLLRMIAGFEFPDKGSVWIRGRDVANVPANERPVNMVFQQYALFPHLSLFENVAFGLRMRKTPEPELRERVENALGVVQLKDMGARMPAQLSGGQQQRVALARAIVNRPELLLLDEPMAALDEKLREDMREELKALQHKIGISFLYVTHDQEEALELADRIAVMEKGRIVQIGTPQEIYESPRSAFVADFVGVSNLLKGKVSEVEHLLVEASSLEPGTAAATAVACAESKPLRRVWLEVEHLGRVEAFSMDALSQGQEVTLSLRPERIHLSTSQVSELENRVSAIVQRTIFLGADIHYHVRLANGTLLRVQTIYSPIRKVRKEGDRVYLQWRSEDATVLA